MKKTDSRKIRLIKKAAACALAMIFLLSACGGMAKSENAASQAAKEEYSSAYTQSSDYDVAAEESADAYYNEEAEMAVGAAADEAGAEGAAAADGGSSAAEGDPGELESSNRKIVYTGNVSLQTLEYDQSAKSIHDKINQCGGFIESENASNNDPYWYYTERSGASARRTHRNLSITARIPAEQFDAFMESLKEDGQVINTSVNAQNISVSYADHDASRKALEIERDRLLEMMEKAQTIEEMIAVEERLTQVERDLGEEKTTLSAMDRDVNFSTVYINLEEVFEYSETVVETTYGERLHRAFDNAIEGFVTFWQEMILFIVETFPFLIMLAILIFVIVKLARRSAKRRMERYAAIQEARRKAGEAGNTADADLIYGRKPRRKGFFGRRNKNLDNRLNGPDQSAQTNPPAQPDTSGTLPEGQETGAEPSEDK